MKLLRPLAAAAVLLWLAGCAVSRPPAAVQDHAPPRWYAPLPHGGALADLRQWWQQFNDPLLRGTVDEFRIYNNALSPEAIAALASGPLSSAKDLADGLLVYPNPATSVIYVDGLDAKTYQYKVYNLVGSVVAQGTVVNGTIRIPEKVATGNYILQLSENQTTVLRKHLLIQK